MSDFSEWQENAQLSGYSARLRRIEQTGGPGGLQLGTTAGTARDAPAAIAAEAAALQAATEEAQRAEAAEALLLSIALAQQTYATILGVQSAYLRMDDAVKWYLPVTGVGLPYDVAMPFMGQFSAFLPQGQVIAQYRFVRKVTFPQGFAGSVATAIGAATNQQLLELDAWSTNPDGINGNLGRVVFNPGEFVGSFSITGILPGRALTFYPGDAISILANNTGNPGGPLDPTLHGISATLLGSIAA
jgi:hypothetical protein